LELAQKRAFLRQMVSQCKNDFDAMKPVTVPQSAEARAERAALLPRVAIDETIRREEEKTLRRPRRWDTHLSRLIDDIEALNERLVDLGLNDQVVDGAPLRQRLCPPPEQAAGEAAGAGRKDAEGKAAGGKGTGRKGAGAGG